MVPCNYCIYGVYLKPCSSQTYEIMHNKHSFNFEMNCKTQRSLHNLDYETIPQTRKGKLIGVD
jgi:hypothetical protein